MIHALIYLKTKYEFEERILNLFHYLLENGIHSWHIEAGKVHMNASTDDITESKL